MDDQNAGAKRDAEKLECRPPVEGDLVALCRELNQRGAKYVVVVGFAIIAAGFPRFTGDVDLMRSAEELIMPRRRKMLSFGNWAVCRFHLPRHACSGG